jgi:rhamnose utilization protein RhaD (predicted bifunctional aldolase and dehydrogenase)
MEHVKNLKMGYSRAYKRAQRKIAKAEAKKKLAAAGKKVVPDRTSKAGIKIVEAFKPYVKTIETFSEYRKRYADYYEVAK